MNQTLPAERNMYVNMLGALRRCAQRFQSSSQLASEDVLLAIEMFGPDDGDAPRAVDFAWFICFSGQSAHHAPTQTFVKMKSCSPLPMPLHYGGLRVQAERNTFVPPAATFRAPMGRAGVGALVHWVEQELAVHVLERLGDDLQLQQVRIRRLLHKDVGPGKK